MRVELIANTLEIEVRGARMQHYVGNERLLSWAENMERIEPEILDWIDAFDPDSVFFDLGASIGLFSIYAAVKVRARVVAFEPEAQNFATMELNHYLNRNRIPHALTALNLALSDGVGLGRICCRFYGAGEHVKILDRPETRDTREAFEPAHVQAVLKQPLDKVICDYGLPAPSYLKIDVDGAELEVLKGAHRTLSQNSLKAVFIETYRTRHPKDRGSRDSRALRLQARQQDSCHASARRRLSRPLQLRVHPRLGASAGNTAAGSLIGQRSPVFAVFDRGRGDKGTRGLSPVRFPSRIQIVVVQNRVEHEEVAASRLSAPDGLFENSTTWPLSSGESMTAGRWAISAPPSSRPETSRSRVSA